MVFDLNPKLLDTVSITPSADELSVGRLTGTVVDLYGSDALLVELSDESGVGRAFVNVPRTNARVVWHSPQGIPEDKTQDSAETLFEEGLLLLQNGLFLNARDKFAKSFAIDPDRARALLNSALPLATAGTFDAAILILRLVVELQPEYVLARENLGVAHLNRGVHHARRGSLDRAVEDFTSALLIGMSPAIVNVARNDLAAAHTQIALRHIEIQRFDEAVNLFLMAFQLEPSPDTRNNLALALISRAASKDAEVAGAIEERFRQPLLMGLSLSECLNAYGVTLARLGNIPRGTEFLRRALAMDAGNELIRKNIRILSEAPTDNIRDLAMWAPGPQLAELNALQ